MGWYSNYKVWIFGGLLIVVALLFIVTLRPAMLGYTTYQQLQEFNTTPAQMFDNIKLLQGQISDYQNNLSTCSLELTGITQSLANTTTTLSICQSSLSDVEASRENDARRYREELDQAQAELEDAREETQEKQTALAQQQTEYDTFARNAANNQCCKLRFDVPSISAYEIRDAKIQCISSGGTALNCSIG